MASSLATSLSSALFSTAQSYLTVSPLASYTISTTTPTITIGIWKVDRATHRTNEKVVSVWSCEKTRLVPRGAKGARGDKGDRAVEVVRKEVSLSS